MKNLIAFRGLKRSWKYSLEESLIDIQRCFEPLIDFNNHQVDLLFLDYDDEPFSIEDKQLITSFVDTNKFNIFWHTIPQPHVKIGGYLTLGYTSWQIGRWKNSHEIETNITYDKVYETRYDILNRTNRSTWYDLINSGNKEFHIYFDRKNYPDNSQLPIILNDFNIVASGSTYDVWSYSYIKNSESMKKLADLYDLSTGFNSRFGAGEGWGIQLRKSGLIPDYHNKLIPNVLRQEHFHYKPVVYSTYDEYLNILTPVNPPKIYYHTKMFKAEILNTFANDTVPVANFIAPAFIVQALNYYRFDLTLWPKRINVLVNKSEQEIVKDLLTAAGLDHMFIVSTSINVQNPIALLNGTNLFTHPLYKLDIRYTPINNTEQPINMDGLLFCTNNSSGKYIMYDNNAGHAYIIFGEKTIYKKANSGSKTHWFGSALLNDPQKFYGESITSEKILNTDFNNYENLGVMDFNDFDLFSSQANTLHSYLYNLNSRSILISFELSKLNSIKNYLDSKSANIFFTNEYAISWEYSEEIYQEIKERFM